MLKLIFAIALIASACSTSSDNRQKEAVSKSSSESFDDAAASAPSESKAVQFGSTLIKSVSNNRLTSRTIKARSAADLARSLGKNKKKREI